MKLLKSIWTRRQFGLSVLECICWAIAGAVVALTWALWFIPVGCQP